MNMRCNLRGKLKNEYEVQFMRKLQNEYEVQFTRESGGQRYELTLDPWLTSVDLFRGV